jgi:hypothetical protein
MDQFLLSRLFSEYLPFSFLISEAIPPYFPLSAFFSSYSEISLLRRIACLLASSYGSGMQSIHLSAEVLRIVRARGN